ncbi:MAG: hypothetical protein Q7L07_00415 [Pseudohongiella sp.]|nr:hypothetical protein [Pseudohongiella sp.]
MDTLERFLSVVGAIASIGAAIWAFIEARNAKKSATKAEQLRNEIVERRTLSEISKAHSETSRILKVVAAVGPACDPKYLKGVNCGAIAREVEEYSRFINEQRSNFNDVFLNRATELCADLSPDIEALSEAATFEDKKSAGKSIYHKINNFLPVVKELSDEKIARADQR